MTISNISTSFCGLCGGQHWLNIWVACKYYEPFLLVQLLKKSSQKRRSDFFKGGITWLDGEKSKLELVQFPQSSVIVLVVTNHNL